MLNFQKKKPRSPHAFTLDPVERERAKGQIGPRRYMHLIFLAGVIVVSGGLLWNFLDGLRNALAPVTTKLNQELPLTPMVKPSIADLPPLPDAAAIAEQRATVADPAVGANVPLWIEQPDAVTLAWLDAALAKDRAAPPLPQRVAARDLLLGHVKVGENVVITGMLEDSQPAPIAGAGEGYQRLLLGLPQEQYLEVLAPDTARDLVIGDEVVVVGRFLGFAVLPPAEPPAAAPAPAPAPAVETGGQPAVTVAATPPVTQVRLPLIAARIAGKPAVSRATDNPYVMRGEWRMPEDIYQNVDDDLLVVETRPYYYTLGQVLLDRNNPEAAADVSSANATGSAIHREPAKFRGQPFTIRGHVFHAWEDEGVKHDQPFGISRVVRIIVWSEDWGDWDVNDGGEIKTKRKLILRAFELAAITHQPLPQPGSVITATGRFLRLRSMEVAPNTDRDRRLGIKRQSDRAHTFLFVTNEYAVMPNAPTYDFTLFGILAVVIAGVLAGWMMWIARRESRKKAEVEESVRRMRESRQALKVKRKGDGTPTGSGGEAIAPEAQTPPAGEKPPEA